MSYEEMKTRLANQGSNVSNSLQNSTIDLVNKAFANSPSYRVVTIDGVSREVRLISDDKSNLKSLLFRPETMVHKGGIVQVDDTYWLITDFDTNTMYPVAKITRCNEVLKWADPEIREYHCVANNFVGDISKTDKIITLPIGSLFVMVQCNNITRNISIDKRFILGSKVYKVKAIDDITDVFNGIGIIRILFDIDQMRNGKDDFENKIADNSKVTGGGSAW